MRKRKSNISIYRIKLRQKKIERHKIRFKEQKRRRNIENNSRKKSLISYEEKRQIKQYNYNKPKEFVVKAAPYFSLLEYPDNVLLFINEVDSIIKKKNKRIRIHIKLSDVVSIDTGSIGLLLSKINELSKRGIYSYGDLPDNELCKNLIWESGFLSHMQDLKGNKFKLSQENSNLMVNRGFDKTSNKLVGAEIRKAVKHLTGVEESFRPVFSIAQEMCANSIEHANEEHKNWLFSICYKEDKVAFTMTDIGRGILGTLKRKASQIIKEFLLKDDAEILCRAFEKKYTSMTKDINRNKGLPKIKKISDETFVNNLIVITNNVLLDFSNESNSRILNKKFNGTFYYWEINKNCIETWKNRRLS